MFGANKKFKKIDKILLSVKKELIRVTSYIDRVRLKNHLVITFQVIISTKYKLNFLQIVLIQILPHSDFQQIQKFSMCFNFP